LLGSFGGLPVFDGSLERTLLSAAFDLGVGFDFRIKVKINVKSSGQECPLHTTFITPVTFLGYSTAFNMAARVSLPGHTALDDWM
jgi:hypothetical protein